MTWALKNVRFHWFLLSKYLMFDLKKYWGVTFHGTKECFKIWRKTDLLFEKWQKFGTFSLEHLKVSKLGLWWDPFVQSRKRMSLKFTEELCAIKMKNAKFEEELTCLFNIDMSNLTNFDSSTRKSKIITL